MSKIKETIKDEVVDNHWEHSQHLVYDSKCSECFKKAPEVKLNSDGFIKVVDNKFDICAGCSLPCEHLYCDGCQRGIENSEGYYH